jgi:hypothetical protein
MTIIQEKNTLWNRYTNYRKLYINFLLNNRHFSPVLGKKLRIDNKEVS